MATDVLIRIADLHVLYLPVVGQGIQLVGCSFQGFFLFCQSECVEQAIRIDKGWELAFCHLGRVPLGNGILSIGNSLDIIEHFPSGTVGFESQGVDGCTDFGHVLGIGTIAQEATVHHAESAIELDNDMFFAECFPTVRYILGINGL